MRPWISLAERQDGWLPGGDSLVRKRPALSSAVADLPSCVDELKSLVRSVSPGEGRGSNCAAAKSGSTLERGADVERFVGQLARRYRAISRYWSKPKGWVHKLNVGRTRTISTRLQKLVSPAFVSYGDAFFVDGN